MYYAISTINNTATGRTGWRIFGQGQTEEEAKEDAANYIGGRGMAMTAKEQTLSRNLICITEGQLHKYGLDDLAE